MIQQILTCDGCHTERVGPGSVEECLKFALRQGWSLSPRENLVYPTGDYCSQCAIGRGLMVVRTPGPPRPRMGSPTYTGD